MRRIFCVVIPLFLLFALCACGVNVNDMSSLNELSRPYTGVYRCERLLLRGGECEGKELTLELCYGGTFELARSGEALLNGEYVYDSERGALTLTARAGLATVSRTFPVEDGALCLSLPFGDTLLYAEFRR